MPVADAEICSVGVDWLTCTTPRTREHESFHELSKQLVEDEARAGNDTRRLRSQGYHGWSAGGASYGVRGDTYLLQLRSDVARDEWERAAALAENVSRLDLQYTVRLETPRPEHFKEQHARAVGASRGRGRSSSITLITSTTEGDSLYLGRRSSDVYARCYDKGREEKLAPAGMLIRYELEFKRARAKMLATSLRSSSSKDDDVVGIVAGHFRRKQIECWSSLDKGREVLTGRGSDSERRLRWLRSGVAPSLARLRDGNRLNEAVHALGICDMMAAACKLCLSTEKE